MLFKKFILDVIEISVVSIHMRGVSTGPKKIALPTVYWKYICKYVEEKI